MSTAIVRRAAIAVFIFHAMQESGKRLIKNLEITGMSAEFILNKRLFPLLFRPLVPFWLAILVSAVTPGVFATLGGTILKSTSLAFRNHLRCCVWLDTVREANRKTIIKRRE